jgi:hypothetical protein
MYGTEGFDEKLARWKSIKYPTIGLIEEYREKTGEIIDSYTMGLVPGSDVCLLSREANSQPVSPQVSRHLQEPSRLQEDLPQRELRQLGSDAQVDRPRHRNI